MPFIDVAQVLATARELRQRANLSGPPYSTSALLKACAPDVLCTGHDLPRGVHEMVEVSADGPIIYYARKLAAGAQRVAIVHGLAHLLWDRDELHRQQCTLKWNGDRADYELRERRADLLAGEVLAPLADLDAAITIRPFPRYDAVEKQAWADLVDRLASRFNVPAPFLRWRLYDLVQLRKSHFYISQ